MSLDSKMKFYPNYQKPSFKKTVTYLIAGVKKNILFFQIFETVDHGRMLVLDGAINLAESDTIAYTHTLMDLKNVILRLY